jgi:hypothetical protein
VVPGVTQAPVLGLRAGDGGRVLEAGHTLFRDVVVVCVGFANAVVERSAAHLGLLSGGALQTFGRAEWFVVVPGAETGVDTDTAGGGIGVVRAILTVPIFLVQVFFGAAGFWVFCSICLWDGHDQQYHH